MRREIVPEALAGERVDRAVALLTGRSRAEVAALVAAGAVRIGGSPVLTRSARLVAGDELQIDLPESQPIRGMEPDPSVEVDVVYADEHLVVVDKPAGLVVHPGAGHERGTLVQGLLVRYPELSDVGEPDRPGVVHRLDKGTSGLLVVARTEQARSRLVQALSARAVHRRYRALVWNHVKAERGLVDAPIGRSARQATRMAVDERGKEARTRYEVMRRYDEPVALTELACTLETGRTHQIRVHLQSIGHPVVGDSQYGGRRQSLPFPRPFLHAELLEFDHPVGGEALSFTAPLPPDLTDLRARLH